MLVSRRLIPAVLAGLKEGGIVDPKDTTQLDFPDLPSTLRGLKERIKIEGIEGNALIVKLADKTILDEQTIQLLGEALFFIMDNLDKIPLLEEGSRSSEVPLKRVLIVSFENVEYLGNAAFGKSLSLHKKADKAGHHLILCNIDPQIYEVLETTGLYKFFNIKKDLNRAIASANGIESAHLPDIRRTNRTNFTPIWFW